MRQQQTGYHGPLSSYQTWFSLYLFMWGHGHSCQILFPGTVLSSRFCTFIQALIPHDDFLAIVHSLCRTSVGDI